MRWQCAPPRSCPSNTSNEVGQSIAAMAVATRRQQDTMVSKGKYWAASKCGFGGDAVNETVSSAMLGRDARAAEALRYCRRCSTQRSSSWRA
jgi:hypothetical protein